VRIGSLFTGYGGLDMAVRAALGGGHTAWHSDTKPASVTLLAHHHPEVPNLGDMTVIDYAAAPPIDVLAASWPCQPHSSAGKRLGEADPRALWPHVARAIGTVRPALFFGENVARVAGNGELRRVVQTLGALGYVGAWRCVRASDVEAPHRRDRCFVVAVDPAAYPFGGGLAQHPERDGGPDAGEVCARGLDAVRRGARGPDRLTLLPTPRAGDAIRGGGDATAAERAMRGDAGRTSATGMSLPRAVTLLPGRWGEYAPAVEHWGTVLGRPAPAPTQPAARAPHGPQLAPAFVEWMMGLPAGHVTDVPGLTRAQCLSLLGDGVVPQQGAYAFRFLLAHLAERLASTAAA